jgi:Uma2 family endonuclease
MAVAYTSLQETILVEAENLPRQPEAPITGEELLALGDIGRCELIDGRIVMMSPTGGSHGEIEITLGAALKTFVKAHQLGRVLGGEVGIYTQRNPDRVRGADVAFISRQRAARIPPGFLTVAPELVVEVMSPDDRWSEVRRKIEEYFSIGVERVWVVEPEDQKVLIFRSPVELTELKMGDTLPGEGALAGFALPLAELFEED